MSIRVSIFLVLVALLEVGGDALIRGGLQRRGALLLLAGASALVAYGLLVNLTKLDFSRLMGGSTSSSSFWWRRRWRCWFCGSAWNAQCWRAED